MIVYVRVVAELMDVRDSLFYLISSVGQFKLKKPRTKQHLDALIPTGRLDEDTTSSMDEGSVLQYM